MVQARRLQCTHHVRVNPMERLTRLVGGVLLAIGAVVAVHTIIEPLYHVSSAASPYSPMWRIIDPLEALAVVLGVIGGYLRTRSVAHDGAAPITRECLAAHALFYWSSHKCVHDSAPAGRPRRGKRVRMRSCQLTSGEVVCRSVDGRLRGPRF